jgi:hypothetical protein
MLKSVHSPINARVSAMVHERQSTEELAVIAEVQRSIYDDKCVLLAGAGLSAQACNVCGKKPPLWPQLIENMATWCLQEGLIERSDTQSLQEAIAGGHLLEAGQELEEILGDTSNVKRCLRAVLLCDSIRPSEAHCCISKLPFKAFLTTNYDCLLETALGIERQVQVAKFSNGNMTGMLDSLRSGSPFVAKLHGDIDGSEPVILGNRSYSRLQYDDLYRQHLLAIFAMHSVLFVGFSGHDPHLQDLISTAARYDSYCRRHWLLAPQGQFPPLVVRRFAKDKGIRIIEYPIDDNHSSLVTFFRKVYRDTRQGTMTETDSIGINRTNTLIANNP